MTPENLDIVAGWAAFVLTLMVFSYLLGDNFLYRIAVHILVGAAAGYTAIAAVMDVIVPWWNSTAGDADADAAVRGLGFLPIILVVFLLLKLLPRYAYIGNFGMLIMLGVGTGVALVGAVMGTVIPLVRDTGTSVNDHEAANGALMLLGTISTLMYFQYLSHRKQVDGEPTQILPVRALRTVGQGFIAVTLGALYAQAVLTSLTIFNELIDTHVQFLFGG